MAFAAYLVHLAILIGMYAILAMSLNVSMGYTGLLNIGHVAFFAIGAYTSALLALNMGAPFFVGLVAGGIMAGVFALVVAVPSVKLRGDYLAIATLGLAIVVENVLRNWTSLTRGPLGLPGIPKPVFFGMQLSGVSYLVLVVCVAVITYMVLQYLMRIPFGRVLRAIREDELVAASLGKNVAKYKTLSLMISAFFAGVAGSLYAHYITFIDPSSFTVLEAILVISMIIIGGLSSVNGAVVGAIILVLLPEPLRFLPLPSFAIGALRQMIYAGLLIMLLVKRPEGIMGEFTAGDKG